MLALDADRKTLFEKDYFKNNKGNPKPDEGFAIPVQAGAISVVRVELLPVDGRNEPILSLAEVQVFAPRKQGRQGNRVSAGRRRLDGLVHKLEPGDHSAVHLRRTLTAEIAGSQRLSLGSGYDAIKVWVNGREVLTKKTKRDAKAGQDTQTVALGQGENEVLIKIVNNEKERVLF